MSPTAEKIQQAKAALAKGDQSLARQLLKQIVAEEPNNEVALMLYADVAERAEYVTYCLQRVLELNPNNSAAKEKLRLLKNARGSLLVDTPAPQASDKSLIPKPSTTEQPLDSSLPARQALNIIPEPPSTVRQLHSSLKRCPYCAEEIQESAIVCRYCGRDLATGQTHQPQVVIQSIPAQAPAKKGNSLVSCLAAIGLLVCICMCITLFSGALSQTTSPEPHDDLTLFISRYGPPDLDESSEYEIPRPPIVTRWLIYEKENLRAVFVADAPRNVSTVWDNLVEKLV